jgi:hypothetical protein
MAETTGHILENTYKWLGALNGATGELKIQQKQLRDMDVDIAMMEKTVQENKSNPFNWLNEEGRRQIRESEDALEQMKRKQDDLRTSVELALIAENRKTEALQRQAQYTEEINKLQLMNASSSRIAGAKIQQLKDERAQLIKEGAAPSVLQANLNAQADIRAQQKREAKERTEKIADIKITAALESNLTKIELRNGSEVEKQLARLKTLRDQIAVIRKRAALLPGEENADTTANRAAQQGVLNQIALIRKSARDQKNETLVSLGGDLVGGKGPLSERERIADRGRDYIRQAEDAVRTGKGPEYVARLTRLGTADLRKAGEKVAQSTSKLGQNETDGLSSKLIDTNAILKRIDANLTPTATPKR